MQEKSEFNKMLIAGTIFHCSSVVNICSKLANVCFPSVHNKISIKNISIDSFIIQSYEKSPAFVSHSNKITIKMFLCHKTNRRCLWHFINFLLEFKFVKVLFEFIKIV